MRLHWLSQLSSRVLHFKTSLLGGWVVKCGMSPGTWSVEVGECCQCCQCVAAVHRFEDRVGAGGCRLQRMLHPSILV